MDRNRNLLARCSVTVVLLAFSIAGLCADEPRFSRTAVKIDVPDLTLINQDGEQVGFRELLLGDKPVYVEFIFATCTTICPVLSAGFASMQRKLGDGRDQVHLISITIDPEHDGPEELKKYLERYRAQPGWDFLTGTRTDIDQVIREKLHRKNRWTGTPAFQRTKWSADFIAPSRTCCSLFDAARSPD